MEYSNDVPSSTTNIELNERCLVCNAEHCKKNYGVRSCESCKIFFRRHAREDSNRYPCQFHGECQITKLTRQTCRSCRLKKCFSVGMNIDLLRSSHGISRSKKTSPSTIHSLDLLDNSRSFLSADQWTLISNIINGYDERSPTGYIRYLISQQSTHPPKVRLKIANDHLMDVIQLMYAVIEPFVNIIPELNQMNNNDRIILIERNIRNLGGFNALFILQDTEILADVAYSNSLRVTYGPWLYNQINRIVEQTQNDGTLVKLFLVILAFSTCSDVVSLPFNSNQSGNDRILTNTECLFHLQNVYTEMMFKYMCYRYGYEQATSRFAHLIQSFLYQSVLTANAEDIHRHESMIQTMVEKVKQSLLLDDSTTHSS